MNTKWEEIETDVTPRLLRMWADRLDKEMNNVIAGDEVPALKITCYDTHTRIILRANQEAWHNKHKGQWQ